MSLILNIETSTTVCSVALSRDGKCIAIKETDEGHTHGEKLTLFIEQVVRDAGISLRDLDAVAVSKGPGSYTGLRIGVSTAKGLCYALDKPLLGIDTLKALSAGAVQAIKDENALYCAMIDARRMEVFCSVFDFSLNVNQQVSAVVMSEDSFSTLLCKNNIYFFGSGAPKCKPLLASNGAAFFRNEIKSSASFMCALSQDLFREGKFENTAYFEPFYLKDFGGREMKG